MGFLDFLTGGGLGAIGGVIAGIAGKVIDLKLKDKELERAKVDHEYDLLLRDKDRLLAAQEAESQMKLHQVDAEARVALADIDALQTSLMADKAAYGDSPLGRVVDFVRGITRPLVTYIAIGLVVYVTGSAMAQLGGKLTAEQAERIAGQGMFIASMAVSWWFAGRPGRLSDYTGKRS